VNSLLSPEIVRMRRPFAAVAVLSTAAAVFSLAGCGSSSTAPNATSFKSLTQAQQQQFETVAVTEVTANVSSLINLNPYSGFGFSRVAARRGGAMMQLISPKSRGPRFQGSGSCITNSGDQTDADGDGVPGNATATWACVTALNPGVDSISGTLTIADPTANTADLDYNANVNLALAEHGTSNGDLGFVLKGQSQLTNTAGSISESGNGSFLVTIANSASGNGSEKLTTNSTVTYTYSGGLLTSFGSLPAGTFNINGNWSFVVTSTNLNANLSFQVSTPGGLAVDQTNCNNNDGHVVSGEADIKFGDGTLVKAVWSGCPATPSVTIS